jgi:hypothetical protein
MNRFASSTAPTGLEGPLTNRNLALSDPPPSHFFLIDLSALMSATVSAIGASYAQHVQAKSYSKAMLRQLSLFYKKVEPSSHPFLPIFLTSSTELLQFWSFEHITDCGHAYDFLLTVLL